MYYYHNNYEYYKYYNNIIINLISYYGNKLLRYLISY